MKISNTPPNYINQTYTSQASGAAAGQNLNSPKPADDTQTDSINLSSKTRDLQKISKALDTNDVERQKYVQDIKQQVENNLYNVNAEQVADKIVGAFMNEVG
jgi:negative regulator of flagellin synthesis FlgM